MELRDARVTIVGLGLMGGSMALRLHERCRGLVGVERDPKIGQLARGAGIETRELNSASRDTDLLVLATPVKETLRLLETFRNEPPEVSLLIDLGSTKREIVRGMEALPAQVPAVGGHPLCGKESSGFEHADGDLFLGSHFVLTPCSRTTTEALSLAERLVSALGAAPLQMEAARHDRVLSVTSHLPYLLAVALMGVASSTAEEDPAIWELTASGFMGTSRLAASDLTMMIDVLETNRDMMLEALAHAKAEIGKLERLLSGDENESLRKHLQPLQRRRAELTSQAGAMHGA